MLCVAEAGKSSEIFTPIRQRPALISLILDFHAGFSCGDADDYGVCSNLGIAGCGERDVSCNVQVEMR
jgi:hypothetical protein